MANSCWSSRARVAYFVRSVVWTNTLRLRELVSPNNNDDPIWRGSALTGEEPPPNSGVLNHALSQAGGPTQFQLSRPV